MLSAMPDIDVGSLSIASKYALDILQNLSIPQVNQLQSLLRMAPSQQVSSSFLTAFVEFCQTQGFDLSIAGVNQFKAQHRLGNSGPYAGVIGPQTAEVYFQELIERGKAKQSTDSSDQQPSNNLNTAIAAAANDLYDMCTADGPDGGNNACAWSINRVLQKAGIPPLGENPKYVPSLLEALQNGRGQLVDRAEAKAGDLVIAYGEAHIGVGLDDGCATVLSNSSSRARFRWESDTDFDGYYGGPSTIYRLIQ